MRTTVYPCVVSGLLGGAHTALDVASHTLQFHHPETQCLCSQYRCGLYSGPYMHWRRHHMYFVGDGHGWYLMERVHMASTI